MYSKENINSVSKDQRTVVDKPLNSNDLGQPSNINYSSNYNSGMKRDKLAVENRSYRIIGLATNLHALKAPDLYAYYCDKPIVLPMMVYMIEVDNEDNTLQYSRNVSKHVRNSIKNETIEIKSKNETYGNAEIASKSMGTKARNDTIPIMRQAKKVQIYL